MGGLNFSPDGFSVLFWFSLFFLVVGLKLGKRINICHSSGGLFPSLLSLSLLCFFSFFSLAKRGNAKFYSGIIRFFTACIENQCCNFLGLSSVFIFNFFCTAAQMTFRCTI